MDRQIVYIGQIPQDTDILNSNKDAYIGLAKACAAILGTSTLLNAFTCTQTTPASMQVQVGPGEIYSLQNIDNTAYGSLAADTTHTIVKQGVILNSTNLTLTAPSTAGFSVNYLIQIGFSEVDTGSTVLPYYNASNPSQAWSGPNNSGTANTTNRSNTVNIQAKQGVAATTGTQTTPSPDTGFVGAFVVTVANGQVTITNANISTYSGAPFITETLTQKISQTTADARYVQFSALQSGQYIYGVDSGAANSVTATLSPAITSYTAGMTVAIKIAATNTGASTINLNSLGAKSITTTAGNALAAGDLQINTVAILVYNGTAFELVNSAATADFAPVNIQNSSYIYAVDTGTTNAYAIALSPALTAYTAGLCVRFKASSTNTGSATLNINSLGAVSLIHPDGTSLAMGDILSGEIVEARYNGTNFQVTSARPYEFYSNAIINGGCAVAQRPNATLSTTAQYGAVDRFACWGTGTAVSAGTIQQDNTASIGASNSALMLSGVTITGSGVVYARHRIEGVIARLFKNQTVSIGLQVLHSVGSNINYTIVVRKPTALDNYTSVTTIATSSAISVATAVQNQIKFENISMGDCSNGIEIEVQAACGAVSGVLFEYSNWKLELSPFATPFRVVDFDTEIRRCMRYYETSYPYGVAPNAASGVTDGAVFNAQTVSDATGANFFKVIKRAVPSVVLYAPPGGSGAGSARDNTVTSIITGFTINDISVYGINRITKTSSLTAGHQYSAHFTADCDL